jgi:enoyl-CoA hydratase
MQNFEFSDALLGDIFAGWEAMGAIRKPIIAAVSGYALGGGCELAMMCDFIIAAENAQFGQPEITLGIIPGIGGTQRLARAVGKAKAMEMCLTGRRIDAAEAERIGLVARVVPTERLIDEAMKSARTIASMPRAATLLAKECVNRAQESSLSDGVRFERRAFHALFATQDQKEGMAAFVEKRKPQFKGR